MFRDDLCIFCFQRIVDNFRMFFYKKTFTEAISFCLPWHVLWLPGVGGALDTGKFFPLGKHTQNVPWISVTLGPCSLEPWMLDVFFLAKCHHVSPRVNLQTITINMGIQAWNSVILVMFNWLRKSWVLASRIWNHDLYNELWTATG